MSDQKGSLTPMQHEIMEIVWSGGQEGIAASVIWQRIKEQRSVARTTILNQVDRLEKRGWLLRRKTDSGFRYSASKRSVSSRSIDAEYRKPLSVLRRKSQPRFSRRST